MSSFTKYVKKYFYNQLFSASEKFILTNLDELGLIEADEEVEIYDAEIMNVYADYSNEDLLNFDVLVNNYILVKTADNHHDEEDTRNRWVRVRCSGILNAGVQNFTIKQVSSYIKGTYSTFINPMSDELVPFIWKDDLERTAENFLKKYFPLVLEVPHAINPYNLAFNMGLQVFEREITEDCSIFGQIYFQDSIEKEVKAGTILIDSNLEKIRGRVVINNTIVHECVHWDKHRKAFELERAYHQELSNISTTLLEETSSQKASATDWMEWQTQTLTPKIMMPRNMFKQESETIIKYLIEKSESKDELDIIEKGIDKLARFFGVSRLSAKIRLVELGYAEAIGAFNFIDGKYVPTHSWSKGFLETNQTFSISLIDAGLQLLTNPILKKNVDTGALVFVESHYCLNESKYISYDIFGSPFLTPYARHHMDECCIVFDISIKHQVGNQTLALTLVLNRDKESDLKFNIGYPTNKNITVEEKAEYIATHAQDVMDLLVTFPNELGESLKALMKWREISVDKLAEESQLDVASISRIRSGKRDNPTLKSIIALCVGMSLPPLLSHKLIQNAGYTLRYSNQEQMLYEIILGGCSSMNIFDCNKLLIEKGFEPLVAEK
ncbi:helix-turn-helix domain-containing protein [Lactococcus lactis]|jgi:transcriptional regulator with XRE-family HTH domain|uniref:HTH cro/C1-type domain-containing protein n=1 Tax=Lactococcus lactis subsp. lactis A12 TaxID=1137134 RepID=S6EX57_LACLL|nr:helix-turn-helix transcriptional regulator [Lactococcus lactis]CDG05790.1 Putative uncharacterized protein [Lactococcus lactis subsp. lactis A12]SBW29291.1 Putative uncharacterized protein [Lactococcus lactis subsp. lactis]